MLQTYILFASNPVTGLVKLKTTTVFVSAYRLLFRATVDVVKMIDLLMKLVVNMSSSILVNSCLNLRLESLHSLSNIYMKSHLRFTCRWSGKKC